jgi:hypothetical protein
MKRTYRSILLLALSGVLPVHAATLTVTNATDGGIGSLRQRIESAASGDLIQFASSLAGATLTLTNQIVVTNNLTINGAALHPGIVIDGGPGSHRLFLFNAGTTNTLIGLNLTGGNGSGGNGGAINSQGTLSLLGCSLYANTNTVGNGGAIYNSGFLASSNCTFSGNSAAFGGALWCDQSATLTHCTIANNTAGAQGGGIYVNTTLTVENSIVAANGGTTDGADVFVILSKSLTRVGKNIIQDVDGGGTSSGPAAINANPLLNALADNGGPTRTRSLQAGSPALDGADGSAIGTDQRGLPRNREGAGAVDNRSDIGAFEAQTTPGGPEPVVVTTKADELDTIGTIGSGLSLREAVRGAVAGGVISFDPAVFAGGSSNRIAYAAGRGQLVLPRNVTITAATIMDGITLDADLANERVLRVATGATVAVTRVTMTGGNGYPDFNVRGGAIYNAGALTLTDCTITNNVSGEGFGGGILNGGRLVLDRCTVAHNAAALSGGGVNNFSVGALLFATNSTIANNASRTSDGGGVANLSGATGTLVHCTIVGNLATNTGKRGGGIHVVAGTLTLANSIVAGNLATANANIDGTVTSADNNLTSGDPMLEPLADNGGPTQTLLPLPGSPVLDAATVTSLAWDQRGEARPVGAAPDLGAVEACLTHRVVTTTVDSGGGSLRAAVMDLCGPTIVTFATNLYGQTISLTNEIVLTGTVSILATNLPGGVTITGSANLNRLFTLAAGATNTLSGLTLTGGGGIGAASSGNGGALLNIGGSWLVTNCVLAGNLALSANGGGGVYTLAGATILNNCTLISNRATAPLSSGGGAWGGTLNNCTLISNQAGFYGGGAYQATLNNCTLTSNSVLAVGSLGGGAYQSTLNNCTLTGNSALQVGGGAYESTLNHCTVTGNSAVVGGGVWNSTLNTSTLSGNTAVLWGGGASASTLNNCTLSGNSAQYGGGAWQGTLNNCALTGNSAQEGGGASASTLNNCTLSGNSAQDGGGAWQGTLNNCTLTGNSASRGGGGAYFCTLNNCIVYFNSAIGSEPNYRSGTITYTCTTPLPPGTGNITNDPMFVSLATTNLQLAAGSPCINRGNNPDAPGTTDAVGNPRIALGTVDMGAYEYDGSVDQDTDGFTDAEEYIADTQPTNAASFFPPIRLTNAPAGQMALVIEPTSTGRVYGVYANTNLLQVPQLWTLVPPEQTGNAAALTLTVTNTLPRAYYRTGVRRP